jgi:hypothetical protein
MWEILDIEESNDILSFRNSDDEPIWMYMRYFVLYNYMLKNLSNIDTITIARKIDKNAYHYMKKAVLNNISLLNNKTDIEVAFYSSTDLIKVDGKYMDRFTDQLSSEIDCDSIIFENAPQNWSWPVPKWNRNTIYYAPNLAVATIVSRFGSNELKTTTDLMNYVSQKIESIFGIEVSEEERDFIIKSTCREMKKIKIHAKWLLNRCLSRNVKLLIMVGGSYSWYYAIHRLFKTNNIKIADLQHGYITSSNVVYNYNKSLLKEKDIKIASPDYLFTYGEWWNNQSNIPYDKKLVIGNPYRDLSKINFMHKDIHEIMIIGCARDTSVYCDMANALGKRFGKENVVFRPHPSERVYVSTIIGEEPENYRIDFSRNIYSALEETDVIISEISTVLFEAIGLVKRIIVWRSDYSKYILPDGPFESAETISGLLNLIEEPQTTMIDENQFWNHDWKKNIKKVTHNILR